MTVRCHVAVVGAGAVGLSAALELRRLGVPDVLVIDGSNLPGRGSSSRANGGVRAQFTTAVNVEFSRFTIAALADLDRDGGGLVGLRRVGYLLMTGTAEGAVALRRACDLQRSLGLAVEWLDAAGVGRIAPYVRTAGLRGATFCATDGVVDPGGVVSALWHEGLRSGVRCLFGSAVSAIDARRRPVRIHAGAEVVVADHVVNAAGPSAREVAALAGVDLPVHPVRRNLACTEPVAGLPEHIPMCVDLDTGVLVRREGAGCILAYSDPSDPPSTDTSFDPAFLEAVAARVGNRFPFLEAVPIDAHKCWAGLYPETADHHAIVDAPAATPWFVQCAGFGGHGIMHSLAAGRAVAELVRDGACTTFDLTPLRLARFTEGRLTVETAVL